MDLLRRSLLAGSLVATFPAQAELGINLYGVSYHFDRSRARELGVDNEVNPGLGVRYRFARGERLDWFADVGAYRDSGRNTALLAGAGALWKLSAGWRVGAALAVFDSATYNRGRTFVAPLPLAAYETSRVTLSTVYLPEVSDFNEVATLGFWATWWLR